MTNTIIGIYLRLSQKDGDLNKNKFKAESESISNQRDLVQNYINSDSTLKKCIRYEFLDDGFSGTNFERPGFKKLMDYVKKGMINCIIVKDFSRFGRDYIALGDYLDRIFPFLGVRFISINDNYDSINCKGRTIGLDMSMKNIVNDSYSKDLAIKITTAKRLYMKSGKYLGPTPPYGFKKHNTIKGQLIIDNDAAIVVKRIFELAINGTKISDIAKILNNEGYLTPGRYYMQHHPNSSNFKYQDRGGSWTRDMVINVLHQEMHYGATVGHKHEQTSPCSKSIRVVPKKERIVIENTHEPIVTKEEWLQAQKVICQSNRPKKITKHQYPLKSKVQCGHCGRVLSAKHNYFKCNYPLYDLEATCSRDKISVCDIEKLIQESLQYLFYNLCDIETEIKNNNLKKREMLLYKEQQILECKNILEQKEKLLLVLIEQLNEGILNKEVFLEKKNVLKAEIDVIRTEINSLEEFLQQNTVETHLEIEQLKKDIDKCLNQETLSPEMVQTFIDKVLFFDKEHIEIKWNFSDIIMNSLFTK